MKIRLTENQLMLLEGLIAEADGVTPVYGLKNLLENINVGSKILISTDDIPDDGVPINTKLKPDSNNYYVVTKIDGLTVSLQSVLSNETYVGDFSTFDKGYIKSKDNHTVTSINVIHGDNIVAIIRPSAFSSREQEKKDGEKTDENVQKFIDLLKGLESKKGENLIFIDDKGKEVKEFRIGVVTGKVMYLVDLTVKGGVKGGGSYAELPFESVNFDSENETWSIKYYIDDNPTIIDNIKNIKTVEPVGGNKEKKDDSDDYDELKSIIDILTNIPSGNVVTFDGYKFIVERVFKGKDGDSYIELKAKTLDDLIFIRSGLSEGRGRGLEKQTLKNYKFTINLNKIKIDDKDGSKMVLPIKVKGKEINITTTLDKFDTSGSESKKEKKQRDDSREKRRKEKEIEDEARDARVDKLIMKNPILRKYMINNPKAGKRLSDKIKDKAGGKDSSWVDKFGNNKSVEFKLIDDSFSLKGKSSPTLKRNGAYLGTVTGKNSDKGTVKVKSKDFKDFFILIRKSLGSDEYEAIAYVFKEFGGKDSKEIEIKIEQYS